ncbi:PREDICTED: uncharacterized protein LOC109348256 [Lupinus angustifolius]|uniref:uncharacterized protein LOC109348256 n=1 Tax=Lupinus angustifolius TaxID=3871 RepID=UPI00092E44FF|nr:PREDICTED: uncharacterized protein LOC109348256 [Lupinus angustifolius]
MGRLATLSEEPINEQDTNNNTTSKKGFLKSYSLSTRNLFNSIKSHFFNKKHDLKILLSVLACPLFPVPPNPKLPFNQVSSSAEYIIQHFTAATGCRKLEGAVKNVFATGKVTMGVVDEVGGTGVLEKGCFVMWQMAPNKWQIEMVVAGHKVEAGCDGTIAWRHTPWLGAHAAKGGVRPLRRTIQGLDPLAVSAVFCGAQYMGEQEISGIDCFMLKLCADQKDLVDRSDNTAEMIKHVTFGYFCQKNGLLVYLEDSYLTRIQSPGTHPIYWETTMSTKIEDYKVVDGVMIAHSGKSNVMITRFGDNIKAGHGITRLEESWVIDDVAFNVPGLSMDCFIPPNELQKDYPQEDLDWRSPLHK